MKRPGWDFTTNDGQWVSLLDRVYDPYDSQPLPKVNLNTEEWKATVNRLAEEKKALRHENMMLRDTIDVLRAEIDHLRVQLQSFNAEPENQPSPIASSK